MAKYGLIDGVPVYIMKRATKKINKKGFVAVQSLVDGLTAMVDKRLIKNVSDKYPEV